MSRRPVQRPASGVHSGPSLEAAARCQIALIKFLKFRNLSPPNNLLIKDLFMGFLQGLGPLKTSLNLS